MWGAESGPGPGGWAGLTPPLCPQRPTDEEGFAPPPGEKSSENYQIVKGVSAGSPGRVCGPGAPGAGSPASQLCWPPALTVDVFRLSPRVKTAAEVQMGLLGAGGMSHPSLYLTGGGGGESPALFP